MTSNWTSSPISTSFAKVLQLTLSNAIASRVPGPEDTLVLSYREDFSFIWELSATDRQGLVNWALSSSQTGTRNLIIVLDGMPQGGEEVISIKRYVTPYDWYFAFSWSLLDATRDEVFHQALRRLRIYFLEAQSGWTTFSHRLVRAFGPILPWLAVYQLVPCKHVGVGDLSDSFLPEDTQDQRTPLLKILLELAQPERKPSATDVRSASAPELLKMLKAIFRSELTKTGNRHVVSNLIGAMYLARGFPTSLLTRVIDEIMDVTSPRKALFSLLELLALGGKSDLESNSIAEQGVLEKSKAKTDLFGRKSNLRFRLIDDQYSLGYNHVLAGTLFGEQYHPSETNSNGERWSFRKTGLGELVCEASPESLFTLLDDLPPVLNWGTPRLLNVDSDILVLDLRFWSDEANSNRRTFFARLLKVADKLGIAELFNPECRYFDAALGQSYRQAQAILNNQEQGTSEIEALALLPLLLSHYDPTLPIIIFSSTHQRRFLEHVAHMPNVITSFVKPMVFDFGEDRHPAELIGELRRALEQAIQLHEARIVWREIVLRAEACQVAKELKYSFSLFKKKRDQAKSDSPELVQYDVDLDSVECLAREYCNTILTGRFADALMVPSNWLEGVHDVTLAGLPDLMTLRGFLRATLDESYPDFGKPGCCEKVFQSLWTNPIHRNCAIALFSHLKNQIQLSSKGTNSPRARKKSALTSILRAAALSVSYEDPGQALGLGLSGLVPRLIPALLGRVFDHDPELQQIGFAQSESLFPDMIDDDVCSLTFNVISVLRHVRAHYEVRPEDSDKVREVAFWCWLWLLAGAVPLSEPPLAIKGHNVGLRAELSATAFLQRRRPLLSAKLVGTGLASCFHVLNVLRELLDDGWIEITNSQLRDVLLGLTANSGSRPQLSQLARRIGVAVASPGTPSGNDGQWGKELTLWVPQGLGVTENDIHEVLINESPSDIRLYPKPQHTHHKCVLRFDTLEHASSLALKLQNTHWLFLSGGQIMLSPVEPAAVTQLK